MINGNKEPGRKSISNSIYDTYLYETPPYNRDQKFHPSLSTDVKTLTKTPNQSELKKERFTWGSILSILAIALSVISTGMLSVSIKNIYSFCCLCRFFFNQKLTTFVSRFSVKFLHCTKTLAKKNQPGIEKYTTTAKNCETNLKHNDFRTAEFMVVK